MILCMDQNFNEFIVKFNELFDQCIPLIKCKVNRGKVPQSPWIPKGMLKSIQKTNKQTNYTRNTCSAPMTIELSNLKLTEINLTV